MFLPCKLSVPCFQEMDPDPIFSDFGSKPNKHESGPAFAVQERCVNAASFRTIFFFPKNLVVTPEIGSVNSVLITGP